ncbi:MAG: 1-acyl-sn-glycerol-3-phosphate acyltransferase [Winogradskyella sp.]|uniref:lysophospholipid acyltransferase family protein n=1 Tax=Winogradskyella sp. TaxID=1883156 RepID=UPI000F3D421B|nr:lysophospholipid acyltransferase family protein [Winogradskyella sp.]RNC88266.1 MAG: 1-acyl-sn-glycerol-3-phosphate acyltransferase [Winogradskyella sp.]
MIKILAYLLTIIYFLFFGLTLVVFHPIQWFSHNLFGYKAHKISVDWMQFFLMRSLNILGTRFSFNNPHKIATGRPVIIVSNHQSMYDIPPLIWYLRKHHVKFVSKKELGKGIPSISYNLRHGGSVLIDRKDAKQALKAIEDFAKRIVENNWAAVIFPEGTRSRDGNPKPFKTNGLLTMFKHAPNAIILPVTVNNSWKTLKYGKFPMGLGAHIKFTVHKPLELSDFEDKTLLINDIEATIKTAII